jgi:hypothetical protein
MGVNLRGIRCATGASDFVTKLWRKYILARFFQHLHHSVVHRQFIRLQSFVKVEAGCLGEIGCERTEKPRVEKVPIRARVFSSIVSFMRTIRV